MGFPTTEKDLVQFVKDEIGPVHLFLGLPCYGCRANRQFFQSLIQLQAKCSQWGIQCSMNFLGNESLITRARSMQTESFYNSGATHLLFIDSDISFDPVCILRLIASKKPVVGCVYSKKGLNFENVAKSATNDPAHLKEIALNFNFNMIPGKTEHSIQDGFMEIFELATGFMLIQRDTIEKMRETYWDEKHVKNDVGGVSTPVPEYCCLFDTGICPDSRRYLSEDFYFCSLARKMGFSIFADIVYPLGHIGSIDFETKPIPLEVSYAP
jgi:hypothetical protein